LDARAANDRIAEKAEELRFISRVPMMCECSSLGCRKLVMVALDDYRAIRRDPHNLLTARGHDADRAELLQETPGYDVRTRRDGGEGNGDRRSA